MTYQEERTQKRRGRKERRVGKTSFWDAAGGEGH